MFGKYKTPLIGGAPATQGDSLTLNQNLTFRIKRYPPDYPAFDDKDLISQGWIENNPDSMFCQLILPTNEAGMRYELSMFPNPANDIVVIDWEAGIYADIVIFDLHGRPIHNFRASGGRKYLDVSNWVPGVYFVQVDGAMTKKLIIR